MKLRVRHYVVALLVTAILILTIWVLSLRPASAADFSMEPQVVAKSDGNLARMNVGASVPFNETFGLYGFAQAIKGSGFEYQQIYAGPYVRPVIGVEIGVGIGKDSDASTVRNVYAAIEYEGCAVFGTIEKSAGYYHKIVATCPVGPVRLGITGEKPFGWGARGEIDVAKDVSLTVSAFRKAAIVGLNFRF